MMSIFKIINYGIYMIFMQFKAIKRLILEKTKGEKAAVDYSGKVGEDWARYTIHNTLNMNVTIRGKENIPDVPCCYIGNHTSILDIPLLIDSVGKCMGFVAKKEMVKAPILGYWMKKYNCVPLDRENAREAIKVIRQGADNIKNGYSMAIFPEGTRSKDGKLREFKKGSLKLATMAKAPVVPVSIDGAYRAYEIDRKFKSIDITVTFGKPIYTENLTREEEKGLMEKVREVIAKNLGQ
ncbi:lysophospholipid acyltransferase family protein [Clostridium tertium]|uniref:lysophospholipid acyltransferase family protein n=1 Tax=Clostridium tertium TaxID=1559 RepID=UPI0024B3222F|nr:lysophospholipid acyltransferase family protein [Clostridium tertium]MDI9216782.1 1-acyl-sn-glycerol-3-phosphate acyltransferase [Clostridium tertium]